MNVTGVPEEGSRPAKSRAAAPERQAARRRNDPKSFVIIRFLCDLSIFAYSTGGLTGCCDCAFRETKPNGQKVSRRDKQNH